MSLVDLQVQCKLHHHIAAPRRCFQGLTQVVYYGVPVLQAEMVSRQPSHAATPKAVVLAVAGPGLPGGSSRQVAGEAGGLDCSSSGVSREMEGTTQRVSWPTSSGTRLILSAKHLTHEGSLIVCSATLADLDMLGRAYPLQPMLHFQFMPCCQACEYKKRILTGVS